MNHASLIRLSPKRAPFSRGGVHFATLAPIIVAIDKISGEHMLRLVEEPLVDVDESRDEGESWRRFEARVKPTPPPVTDAARSPERAVDPSGPLVPRAMIRTPEGLVAPPSAADPAVPLAGEREAGRDRGRDRPVAQAADELGEHGDTRHIDGERDMLVPEPTIAARLARGELLSESEVVAEEVRLANLERSAAAPPTLPAATAKAGAKPAKTVR